MLSIFYMLYMETRVSEHDSSPDKEPQLLILRVNTDTPFTDVHVVIFASLID